jgi:hypothetical protein
MFPIPNDFRGRAISLYSCKIVDKWILRIVSNIGIYCSSDKFGTVYLVHFRKFHRQHQQWHFHRISVYLAFVNVRHCAQHSYSVTINSYNSQMTLHADSHASYSGAVRREWRTILGAKSKIMCSEIALSRKPFAIGHMYIYSFFCVEWPILWLPSLSTFPPGTCCITDHPPL